MEVAVPGQRRKRLSWLIGLGFPARLLSAGLGASRGSSFPARLASDWSPVGFKVRRRDSFFLRSWRPKVNPGRQTCARRTLQRIYPFQNGPGGVCMCSRFVWGPLYSLKRTLSPASFMACVSCCQTYLWVIHVLCIPCSGWQVLEKRHKGAPMCQRSSFLAGRSTRERWTPDPASKHDDINRPSPNACRPMFGYAVMAEFSRVRSATGWKRLWRACLAICIPFLQFHPLILQFSHNGSQQRLQWCQYPKLNHNPWVMVRILIQRASK